MFNREFISNDQCNNAKSYEKKINYFVIKLNDTNTFLKGQNLGISTKDLSVPKNPTCTLKELRHKSVQDESHDFNTDMQRDPIHGNASTCDNHDDTDNSDTYTPSGIVSGAIGDCYSYFCFFIRL